MFLYLFSTLLLLFFTCYVAETVHADDGTPLRVTLFKRRERNAGLAGDYVHVGKEFDLFRASTLVEVEGMIVAVAEAHFKENNTKYVGIVARSLGSDGHLWNSVNTTMEQSAGSNATRLLGTTVNMSERLIDVVLGAHGKLQGFLPLPKNSSYWKANVFTTHVESEDKKYMYDLFELRKINVTVNMSFSDIYTNYFEDELKKRSLKHLFGIGGAGIKMQDGTFVFPVQALTNEGKIVSLTLRYESNKSWNISKGKSAADCTNPVVLEWKDDKLLMVTSCDWGHYKVYESTDKGDKWVESVGSLSRVWGNSPKRTGPGNRGGFITANIDGTKVILFAHPISSGEGESGQLRLWMSDGSRIFDVSVISAATKMTIISSLLYKDDKLYCLYEINDGKDNKIVFEELSVELKRIKETLRSWAELDKNILEYCKTHETNSGLTTTGTCNPPIPTSGLVGFLSNKSKDTYWYDEYLCVNASMRGATQIPNGLTFKGAGTGAQWPVSKQGYSQRYYFANREFTLAATVAIHAIPTGITPLLGVSLSDSGLEKLLALLITSDRQLMPMYGNSWFATTGSWELHKEYQVVFTWKDNRGSIYLDGVAMERSREVFNADPINIKYFFFGGYGTGNLYTRSKISVTNVLLYNRMLNDNEVKALLQIKGTIPIPPPEEETVPLTTISSPAAKPFASGVVKPSRKGKTTRRYLQTSLPKSESPLPKSESPLPKPESPLPKSESPLPKSESPLPKEPSQVEVTQTHADTQMTALSMSLNKNTTEEEQSDDELTNEDDEVYESLSDLDLELSLSDEIVNFSDSEEVFSDVDTATSNNNGTGMTEQINALARNVSLSRENINLGRGLLEMALKATNNGNDGTMGEFVPRALLCLLTFWGISAFF